MKRPENRIFALLLLICLSFTARAQDFHYTQFYAAPLHLSPAFTGSMETTRIGVNYRKQWPGLGYEFNATSIYLDTYFYETNFSVGFSANNFEESLLKIRNVDLAAYVSYRLQLGSQASLRFGGQFGAVNRSITLQELVFGDQIDLLTRSINPGSMDLLPDEESRWYPDISFGALVQTPDFWLGVSSHHVTQPNIGYLDENIGNNLPIKWGLHGGWVRDLDRRRFKSANDPPKVLSVSFNYKRQGSFQQIEVIPQVQLYEFIVGAGFRNITRFNDLPDQNSINGLIGFNLKQGITLGYSYDYMLNRFSSPAHVSHEISLFFVNVGEKKNRQTILPCYMENQPSTWRY